MDLLTRDPIWMLTLIWVRKLSHTHFGWNNRFFNGNALFSSLFSQTVTRTICNEPKVLWPSGRWWWNRSWRRTEPIGKMCPPIIDWFCIRWYGPPGGLVGIAHFRSARDCLWRRTTSSGITSEHCQSVRFYYACIADNGTWQAISIHSPLNDCFPEELAVRNPEEWIECIRFQHVPTDDSGAVVFPTLEVFAIGQVTAVQHQ